MNGSTEPVDERCIITHNNYRKGWGFGLKLISLYRSINLQHLIHAARIGAVIKYPSMAGCIVKAGPVHTIGYRTKFTHKNPGWGQVTDYSINLLFFNLSSLTLSFSSVFFYPFFHRIFLSFPKTFSDDGPPMILFLIFLMNSQ